MDLNQLRSNLDLFSHHYRLNDSIEKTRNNLKKVVLKEIVKSDSENKEFYQRCLDETNYHLSGDTRQSGYPCTLVGCQFVGKRHVLYLVHIRRDHPNLKKVTCNFNKTCRRSFSSIETLISHLKDNHSQHEKPIAATAPLVDVACRCNMTSCGGFRYKNTGELMTHFNSYHANEERECIFTNCRSTFHAGCPMSARNHFKLKHKQTGELTLKNQFLEIQSAHLQQTDIVNFPVQAAAEVEVLQDNLELFNEDEFDALENLATEETNVNDEVGEEYYLQYYSDFLNRLGCIKFVPQSTIQEISDEYLLNTKKSLKRQEQVLRRSLADIQLDPSKVDKIVEDVFSKDPFLKAQLRLNSEYKRLGYIRESASYVHPQEVVLNKAEVKLGARKEVLHYVSIVESFKTLVQDPSFIKMFNLKKVQRADGKIRDIEDGSVYKTNAYFKNNPEAYTALLYSDGVEMKNPLGAAKGTYKIVAVYYTLGEIDKSQRSQIDRLQLVMVFREKLLKKYSLKTLFKPFIDDLKTLEIGVEIKSPSIRKVKLGAVAYASDNLEASLVGGFSSNFSSKDICRLCHIQHPQLEEQVHDVDGKLYGLWTAEEYNEICASLETDVDEMDDEIESNDAVDVDVNEDNLFTEFETLESEDSEADSEDNEEDMYEDETVLDKRGVKSECPLNVLQSFHSTSGFPFDVMHDFFEGSYQ